ncbi:MAG: gliding motility-associated C-terminal domain-containing protein [Cryomorphaceae bacterium]|nr:gliding motility-associated C-terminal domain-containing protein [Cryomorphaceae bacterium]
MKKIIGALLVALSFTFLAEASHVRGGEVFWYCISQDNRLEINAEFNSNFTVADHGKFVFVAKLYGDCTGANNIFINSFVTTMQFNIGGYSGGGPNSSPVILVSSTDISPDCFSSALRWTCNPPTNSNSAQGPLNGAGSVSEHVYRSNAFQLNGSPPTNGAWVIGLQTTAGAGHCCRNGSNNVNGQPTFYLKSEMYPYPNVANPRAHGSLPPFRSMNPCYDNSPEFLELPNVVSCIGEPFTYGPLAFDIELDSLVYDWGTPLISPPNNSVTFSAGFSATNPMPSTAPSVAANLDPVTGLITFESHAAGTYTTNTEVLAYKCGLPVALISRDIQIVTANCAAAYTQANPPITPPVNNPPSVTFIPDSTLTMTTPAPDIFRFTVEAGDTVAFTLNAQDFDLLPNSQFQTITFEAASGQLGGSNWTDTNNCNNPPCALLNPATGQTGYVASLNNTVEFFWVTDCNHLASEVGCGVFSNEYVFYLKMEDNFCPTPSRSLVTVVVDVQAGASSTPVDLYCASRDGMGSVDLSFIPGVDTGFRFNFHIVEIDTVGAGNFFAIDTIYDYDPVTWSLPDTIPHPSYFRIRMNVGCEFTTPPSLIAGTMALDLTPLPLVSPDKDTADLKWNNPRPNDSVPVTYEIEAEIPAGSDNWVFLGSLTDREWIEAVSVCDMNVNFRVRFAMVNQDSTLSCYSYSNMTGAQFSDVTNDDTMRINYVTVNEDGLAVIDFQPSNTGDIVHYYILYFNEMTSSWDIIDTVGGMAAYVWQNSQADTRPEKFKILSVDSCGNISDDQLVIPHNTLVLNSEVDVCEGINTLTWNRYAQGWGNSLVGYELRADIDDPNVGMMPDVVLFTGGPNDTSFIQEEFISGAIYCYRVVAIHLDSVRESSSYPICMNPGVPQPTELLYLSETDVRGDGVFFRGFTDGDADANTIIVERATQRNGTYFELARIQAPQTAPYTFTYIDYLAKPNDGVYYYRIIAADSCDGVDTISNIVNNIKVEVEAKRNEQNWVTWNSYKGFAGDLDRYEVYRAEGEDGSFSLIAENVSPNDTVYVDRIGNVAKDVSTLCYYVRAVETNNPQLLPDGYGPFRSRSNRACVTQKVKLVLPNAFKPLSPIEANRTFGAKNRFADVNNFEMIIIDRWGKVVFETKDPNIEWDGYIGGSLAPTGVYSYLIRYQSVGALPEEVRGTFTLIQ